MKEKVFIPVWAFGMFITLINTTMFNVSIPSVIQELEITASLGSWIISSYSIAYALSTVIYSRLTDTVPVRKLLLVGLSIFGLSSIFGIFADHFYTVLATRILQAAGGGVMAGLGLVIVSRYIPAERRGRALTLMSIGNTMSFSLGPIIGGVITQFFGFNGLFGVTCLILLVLPILFKLLPKEVPAPGNLDIVGALLTIVNAGSLLIAVSLQSWLWLAICLVSLLLHYFHMKKGKELFIHPGLLKVRGYGKLMAIGLLALMLNMGNLFLMPLVLANFFDQSPLMIGLMIAPGATLSALMARTMGFWIDRFGSMRVLPVNLSITVGVMILFAFFVPVSPIVILLGYMLFSPCFSGALAALNKEASLILPRQWIGAGMGLLQMLQFLGGALSVALCGILLERIKGSTIAFSYQGTYGWMAVAGIFSLAIVVWYRLAMPKEENSNNPAKA